MNVLIDGEPTLEWLSGTDPDTAEHVLYSRTDETWVTNALPTDPCATVLPVETETYQHPEPPWYDTGYFWRLDEATGNLNDPEYITRSA